MIGFLAFVADGNIKIVQADRDFEPDKMGVRTLWELRDFGWAYPREVRSLLMLPPHWERSDEDLGQLRRLGELVAEDPAGLARWVLAVGVAEDRWEIPSDSSTVGWGYVIDLDHRRFEVYEGCQTRPHRLGRFIDRPQVRRGFCPPKLVADFAIPEATLGLPALATDAPLPSDAEFLATVALGATRSDLSHIAEVLRRLRR